MNEEHTHQWETTPNGLYLVCGTCQEKRLILSESFLNDNKIDLFIFNFNKGYNQALKDLSKEFKDFVLNYEGISIPATQIIFNNIDSAVQQLMKEK